MRTAGAALAPVDDTLARILTEFLRWTPTAPRSISQLVTSVAPLTRLLREEVSDTLALERTVGDGPFTSLARDWRVLLFPEADDEAFADGYAQTVTFALLLARSEAIAFDGRDLHQIASALGASHSLMGKALAVLTDETIGALTVSVRTLVRVISAADFTRFESHQADQYKYLYERFLQAYDPELRKKTGSYYTPAPVVSAMTRLTHEVLRTRLGRAQGLADPGVTIVDPAMGAGQYVVEILETVADVVEAAEGSGAVGARLTQAAARLVGVEIQTGPYAVAELRVAAELRRRGASSPVGGTRLYVADTLDDPYAEEAQLAAILEPIAVSRRRANAMKAHEPVLVVLGNPPYRDQARGHGGFIEFGSRNTADWNIPPLGAFREPGNGQAEYVLSNMHIFFWRWATWKVFDAHPTAGDGVVCFITTSAYLQGPGFAGMRRYLRSHASEGWVIDCTPEGDLPDTATRIFGDVQQPICIGLFVRTGDTDQNTPAHIRYTAVTGRVQAKFEALNTLALDGELWRDAPREWTAPFLPAGGAQWRSSPALGDLMPWQSQGIVAGRTWVYAPLAHTLRHRWNRLMGEPAMSARAALMKESRDANLAKGAVGLPGLEHPRRSLQQELAGCVAPDPVQVGYRSFDTQWVLPDDRLLSTPRKDLWRVRGAHQVYVTEQHAHSIAAGSPGLTFTAFVPDIDHYKGSAGGRAIPLYASTNTVRPNLAPGLLALMAARLGVDLTPEDMLAYVAAVTAHPGFTHRFAAELRNPGVRVPLTADGGTWHAAVTLGRRVLWLHTRGQRYADPQEGRPSGPPQVACPDRRPKVLVGVGTDPATMPDTMTYDPAAEVLTIGAGQIGPVTPAVAAYEVSGMNVLRKWFGYRRRTRPKTRGEQSPLDDLRPASWPTEYTSDLLELLNVLTCVVDLQSAQEQLLEQVMAGPQVTVDALTEAGVLPVPGTVRTLPREGRGSGVGAAQPPLPGQ